MGGGVKPITDLPCTELLTEKLQHLSRLRKDDLIGILHDMIHDWQKLNQIHNDRASSNGWCPEYEERQARYNAEFKVMKLSPRSSGLTGSWTSRDRSML